MVQLILGNKGSGKTKRLIEMCNEATAKSKGHVVLVEKNNQLSYNITYRTRLVAADEYDIQGFDAFYGFISGMCAANYDITDIFVDSTLKITGYDFEKLADLIEKLDSLSKKAEVNIVMTVSADKSSVPGTVSKYALD